ncbi:Wobble nucleotide-excising tRNase [Verrucomicrobium sp. GAS474]|uniref:AAA family ATPase n=1 Tax=Verrucomicrobium sp. GAS474 TaxID=1882831 RepID=UPI00087AB99F|nr:AAA family ATPase [Verrucomicrobium sp. GAS474]SDU29190.1 Wobble nucleotide-excising tRNase [Verrucomicrobium sp. GAS474]
MIESIKIADVATYRGAPESLHELSKFNFVFGSNGTGKTTVSRVIAEEADFPSCQITWKGGTRLQPMVYNHDFVDKNFNQSTELKGVFTLGEKQADTLSKIAAAKAEVDAFTGKIEVLTKGLEGEDGNSGKKGEIAALEVVLKDKCWATKTKHDAKLQGAFEGVRASSDKFKAKVLQEWATNTVPLVPLDELERKASTVFGDTPSVVPDVAAIESAILLGHESNPILAKRVIGKADVDIAAIIKKLGNSDWVKEGRTFYDETEKVCPFCQQKTEESFASSLNEYFDETFVADSKAIDDLATNYQTDSARLQQQLDSLLTAAPRFLDIEKLKSEKELFDAKVSLNIQRLAGKKKEASQVVELESLSNVLAEIEAILSRANGLVLQHNQMVANLGQERLTLKTQVWRFVLEELKADLDAYKSSRESLDRAVASMTEKIQAATADKAKKEAEIREFEKQATSIRPTIVAINDLLKSFGFRGFSLAEAANGISYKLVRADNTDAKATLSEGEKTFVTFLYFYHLLKGSASDSGMTADRIVVFDDPVSSLDSDILFIVSSLIKGIFEEVRDGIGHIKQVFVLTHNVYFHKEVTFNPRRSNNAAMHSEETFWIVRKPDLLSKVEKHASNPIKTSYELLWGEVRRADRSNLTIQNTLRRILENYFKILGGVDPDKICAMFEGKEKHICKSLFSWVNDGSHFAHDDVYVSIDSSMVEPYLEVFRSVFEKSKHEAHYKMMMGDAYQERVVTPVAV